MKLVILLLCLACERYFGMGSVLNRFHWLEQYIDRMQRAFNTNKSQNGWLWLAIFMLPILIGVAIIYLLTRHWVFGLVGLFLDFIILLYCLGPDLYHQLQLYFKAKETDNVSEITQHYSELTGFIPPQDPLIANRKLTEVIFIQANERFFGVIIWYLILGPIGALWYRLAVIFRYKAEQGKAPCEHFLNEVTFLQNLLDWLPARITVLLYLIVGNFHGNFKLWRERFAMGLEKSQQLLIASGIAALNVSPEVSGTLTENKQAADLVDRALIVLLVIMGLFTIVSWM